jgi:hypothetical protein
MEDCPVDLTTHLPMDSAALAHCQDVYRRYRLLHDDPQHCRPMIIVNTPVDGLPTCAERLADPLLMLRAELDAIRPHLEIRDDRVPTVRVQFGTAQVPAAFGCDLFLSENNLPAAENHVLSAAADVHALKIPALDAGWYGKLAEWTKIWRENLPPGVHIQHPDIQSPFNSAHLIRGNDILTDFYDCPEDVDALLDKVTDFMLAMTRHVKAMISDDPDWFFDWGAMWKGAARISNCSMQMISPDIYREHVLPRDIRFFDGIGGGRMHYCGITGDVIDDFLRVPSITGLDVDVTRHDFFALCERAPERIVLMPTGAFEENSSELKRFLQGDWPRKRNIVVVVNAASVEAGKDLLKRLRDAIP